MKLQIAKFAQIQTDVTHPSLAAAISVTVHTHTQRNKSTSNQHRTTPHHTNLSPNHATALLSTVSGPIVRSAHVIGCRLVTLDHVNLWETKFKLRKQPEALEASDR